MNRLGFLSLLCGMSFLVAQEPPVEKKDGDGKSKDGKPKVEKDIPFGTSIPGVFPLDWKSLIFRNDQNKDKMLSEDEFKNKGIWNRLKRADVNKDGKINETEFNDLVKDVNDKLKEKRKKKD